MNRRYRPQGLSRALALLGAVAVTGAVLAGIHVQAAEDANPPLAAVFTGEVTAHGPVYRLPDVEVKTRGGFLLALPGLIDRAFEAHAKQSAATARPDA